MIVGLENADDAGVYRISEDLAIIQTVDFFTPIVDDPYEFGQIAAANALSDIYAMGGEPKTAMNLVAFPVKKMEIDVLKQILEGGIDKLKEAEVVLIGGHSIEDNELKYGLSVTGFIRPDQVLVKKNLRIGDSLILTKSLGTGIIATAAKGRMATPETIEKTTQLMKTLNRTASRIMRRYEIHACTDITGFGLLGHLSEMVIGSGHSVRLKYRSIPIIPEAIEFAKIGFVPAGTFKNREFRKNMIHVTAPVGALETDILFDPQTSGGLLISVHSNDAEAMILDLKRSGIEEASIIGEVIPTEKAAIFVE